jgi:hypothetical protein
MKTTLAIRLCIFVAMSMSAIHVAYAASCPEQLVSRETWVSKWGNPQADAEYVSKLKGCLSWDFLAQADLDTLAVSTLIIVEQSPALTDIQKRGVINFVAQVLEADATAGYSSSQHNYAVLFNAQPGSLVAKTIVQDQMTFGQWTKTAAAQKEPRAMFNLAIRMAVGVPDAGIAKNPETAYTLLILMDQLSMNPDLTPAAKMFFQGIKPISEKTKKDLETILGASKAKELTAQSANFDYSSLAPKKPYVTGAWDHDKNVRSAVENFLSEQNTQGNLQVVSDTKSCYLAAMGDNGLTKDKEYCVAFDAADIEYTTAFYRGMAAKLKQPNMRNLQPEETLQSAGQQRIVQQMSNAKVSNAEMVGAAIYRKATQALFDLVKKNAVAQANMPNHP